MDQEEEERRRDSKNNARTSQVVYYIGGWLCWNLWLTCRKKRSSLFCIRVPHQSIHSSQRLRFRARLSNDTYYLNASCLQAFAKCIQCNEAHCEIACFAFFDVAATMQQSSCVLAS